MIGPFAILDEDFGKYLLNFHIIRAHIEKRLDPPDDILEFLFEKRTERLPQRVYKEQEEYSLENLEGIIGLIYRQHTTRNPKISEETGKKIYSFEHDPISLISKIQTRVKVIAQFWPKSIYNIKTQSETGAYDFMGARIIVETPKAVDYRTNRKPENLSRIERREFDKKFSKHYKDLNEKEKEKYAQLFKREYPDLTEKEKNEYNNLFGDIHRKKCLELAVDIVSSSNWNSIPVNPHYLILDDIRLRSQTQHILDKNGKILLEFDYHFLEDPENTDRFIEKVLDTAAYESLSFVELTGVTLYKDYKSRDCCMIKISPDLILNFYSPFELDIELIENLSNGIVRKYGNSVEELLETLEEKSKEEGLESHIDNITERAVSLIANKLEEIEKEASEKKEKAKRVNEFLQNIKLNLENLEPRQFIYSETTTRDLMDKYEGIITDPKKIAEIFIKNYLGKNKKPETGYESVHFDISYGESKQFVVEFQVRDPAMDEEAERGRAKHEKHKKIRYGKIASKKVIELGKALFGTSEEDEKIYFRLYNDLLVKKLNTVKGQIFSLDSLITQEDEFRIFLDDMLDLYDTSKCALPEDYSQDIKENIESLTMDYVREKGLGCIKCYNSIKEMNTALKLTSRKSDFDMIYHRKDRDLHNMVYSYHINLLYQAFEEAAKSNSKSGLVTSFCIAELIKNYTNYYGKRISGKIIEGYAQRIDTLFKQTIEQQEWRTSDLSPIGYLPSYFRRSKTGLEHDFQKKINHRTIQQFLNYSSRKVSFGSDSISYVKKACESLSRNLTQ